MIVDKVLADFQPDAVVGEDIEFLDVVVGFSRHHRMHAAGVIADHAAQSAAVVTGGVGPEGEVMLLGGGAKIVENHAGLHASDAAGRVDLNNPRHIFREIEDDCYIAALAGQ